MEAPEGMALWGGCLSANEYHMHMTRRYTATKMSMRLWKGIWFLLVGLCFGPAKAQVPLCVDESFQMPYAPTGTVTDIAFMDDDRIIVAGYLKNPGEMITYFGMTRLEPNGSIDPSFGPSNVQAGSRLEVRNEFIYLRSGGGGYPRLFLENGTNDLSYQSGMAPDFSTSQAWGYHLFPNGKQWRTGTFHKQIYDEEGNKIGSEQGYGLVQVLPDGHVDPDFDHKRMFPGSGRSLCETPDGRFLLSTYSNSTYEGQPVSGLIRIWPDGHLDTTFHSSINWGGGNISNFYFYPDGRILVFGRMMAPEYPNDTLAIMRLHPDGSTDTSWPSIPFLCHSYFRGLAFVAGHLEIEPGKLIVVGDFNAIGNQPMGSITTIDTAGNVLWDYLPGTGGGFTEQIDTNQPYCYFNGIKEGPEGFIYLYGTFMGYNDGCGDHPAQHLLLRLYPLDVGVEEHTGAVPALAVYPSPGGDQLSLSWDVPGRYEVAIRDLQGRTVWQGHYRKGEGPLDMSGLVPGMYVLTTTTKDGIRASAQWVKL